MRNIYGLIISILDIGLVILISNLFTKASKEASRKFIHIMLANWWIIAMIFFDNVWLGSGYGKNQFGSSNSLFVLMADGGLFMMAVYGYSLLLWPFVQIAKKQYSLAIMYLLYFSVFSITIILYTELSLLMIAYPLSRILELKKKVILLK